MKNFRRAFTLLASVLTFSLFCLPNGNADPVPAIITQVGNNWVVDVGWEIDQTLGDANSYLGDLVGTFDGNSKTISGLEKPLFNEIKSTGEVKDLTATTTTNTFVANGVGPTGVVAKTSEGEITRVTVSGTIDANNNGNVGGVVGQVTGGSIDSTTANVDIQNGGNNIGGLVGAIVATKSSSTSIIENVTDSTSTSTGSVSISNSQATGDVTGGESVGGLIGGQ